MGVIRDGDFCRSCFATEELGVFRCRGGMNFLNYRAVRRNPNSERWAGTLAAVLTVMRSVLLRSRTCKCARDKTANAPHNPHLRYLGT